MRRTRTQDRRPGVDAEPVVAGPPAESGSVAASPRPAGLAALDAVPARWVTERLRQAVTSVESARHVRQEHAQRRQEAADALTAAAADPFDLDAAVRAASDLQALERVEQLLPAVEFDRDAAGEALAMAERELVAAAQDCSVPPPAYVAERKAWQSLGPEAVRVDPPTATVSDVAAEREFARILAAGRRLHTWLVAWQDDMAKPGANVLDLLGAAGGLLEKLAETKEQATRAERSFSEANAERRRLGLTWKPPAMSPPVTPPTGQRVIVR